MRVTANRATTRAIPIFAFAGGLALLAACQSAPKAPAPQAAASNEAHELARHIGDAIHRCWFGPKETAFAGYIYSPEPNAVQPRILIVRKDNPAERPVLVVETRGASGVTSYGPLAQTPTGLRIRTDLDRWAKGSERCS
jgi:hypothetical protein